MAVFGLVPAAGRGSRFAASEPGAPLKLLTMVDGEAMVRRTVTALLNGGAARCVVVVAGETQAGVRSALTGLPVRLVVNPDPERGMFSSIQCGVARVRSQDRCVLLPGDMPYVRPDTVAKVLAAALGSGQTTCASYDGRRGHPLVFSTILCDRILRAPANAVLSELRSREECLSVEVLDPGVHRDVDRPGDLIIGA
ncbi:MAG: nucleotidyltransferase family protein [Vicinamibacterales bacterium]